MKDRPERRWGDTRKVAHNTYLEPCARGYILRYHGNTIAHFLPDRILVCHAGWPTSTTCDRFRHLLPFQAYRKFSYETGRLIGMRRSVKEQTIFVAGVELPADGSAIAFTWDGKQVV